MFMLPINIKKNGDANILNGNTNSYILFKEFTHEILLCCTSKGGQALVKICCAIMESLTTGNSLEDKCNKSQDKQESLM